MTKYTRDQAKDSKNDNFVIALDYKNSQEITLLNDIPRLFSETIS